MQEMQVRFLGTEDPLEEEMAACSSILTWEIPWTEEPGRATVHGVTKSWTRLNMVTSKGPHPWDLNRFIPQGPSLQTPSHRKASAFNV